MFYLFGTNYHNLNEEVSKSVSRIIYYHLLYHVKTSFDVFFFFNVFPSKVQLDLLTPQFLSSLNSRSTLISWHPLLHPTPWSYVLYFIIPLVSSSLSSAQYCFYSAEEVNGVFLWVHLFLNTDSYLRYYFIYKVSKVNTLVSSSKILYYRKRTRVLMTFFH